MTKYHRDSKKFIEENCKDCPYEDGCDCLPIALGNELVESGEMPDADPTKFYMFERCPTRWNDEGSGIICEGCIHYRPFHGKPDSDEYECELGMELAYECMSNGFDKKKDRLKPCPFCGSKALMYEDVLPFQRWSCVRCSSKDCEVALFEKTLDEAVEKWNRRVKE